MLHRPASLEQLSAATKRSPITALLGPRQCGKTTLAGLFAKGQEATFFDMESVADRRRLQNPELALGGLSGLVILDEIQAVPELFSVLRGLADRPDPSARFLILGSASPHIIRHAAETLAGRVEFVELSGFNLSETGSDLLDTLWLRGGFPRSFLAASDEDSFAWREGTCGPIWSEISPNSGSAFRPPRCGDSGPCSPTITGRPGMLRSLAAPWGFPTRLSGVTWTF